MNSHLSPVARKLLAYNDRTRKIRKSPVAGSMDSAVVRVALGKVK